MYIYQIKDFWFWFWFLAPKLQTTEKQNSTHIDFKLFKSWLDTKFFITRQVFKPIFLFWCSISWSSPYSPFEDRTPCMNATGIGSPHDDVIKWKHFPRYWSFVRGIHRSPVNSPHKGQWCGALMFSLFGVWINGWVNNPEAGDLIRYRAIMTSL